MEKKEKTKSVEVIKQSQIAFELADGSTLLLHKEDYETLISKIRMDVVLDMMADCPDRVYITKEVDHSNKIKVLRSILEERKGELSQEIEESYLKAILDLSTDNSFDSTSMEELNQTK